MVDKHGINIFIGRFIDCANDYDNEHVIGEALQELFAEGTVTREELFIQVSGATLRIIKLTDFSKDKSAVNFGKLTF